MNQAFSKIWIIIAGIIVVFILLGGFITGGFFWMLKEQAQVLENELTKPLVVKQVGGSGLLITECGDKNYVSNTADYIVEGTVESVESKWNDGKTSIFTYTDLAIGKYVKGSSFMTSKIRIITPGGTVEGITQTVEDQPIFHQGKKVRIYFQKVNEEFTIVCGQFGVEEIITEETCKNLCGDGICQEIVCLAIGCPCPETKESCPQDCR